jgi:hypothetical protein
MSEVGRWPAYLVATAVVRIVSSMARNHRFVYDFVPDPIAQPRATRIRDAVLGLALALVRRVHRHRHAAAHDPSMQADPRPFREG